MSNHPSPPKKKNKHKQKRTHARRTTFTHVLFACYNYAQWCLIEAVALGHIHFQSSNHPVLSGKLKNDGSIWYWRNHWCICFLVIQKCEGLKRGAEQVERENWEFRFFIPMFLLYSWELILFYIMSNNLSINILHEGLSKSFNQLLWARLSPHV